MNHTSLIFISFSSVAGILLFAIGSNAFVYAQQHVAKIKITSPTRGQQVPAGKDLTVSGTSADNAASNDCKVSVIVNKVRPYQNTTAAGTGGAADYSKWNFVLTSKYTTIKPGENRITAKYECTSNPDANSFSSVNITGVQRAASAATSSSSPSPTQQTTSTKPTTANITAPKQQQVKTSNNNTTDAISGPTGGTIKTTITPVSHNAINASSASSIAPQIKAVNHEQKQPLPIRGINSTTAPQVKVAKQQQLPRAPSPTTTSGTAGQNDVFAATPLLVTSGKLMYLGYHDSKSNSSNYNSNSTDKSFSSNSKPSSHSSDNNGSTTSKTRGISTHNTNSDSNSTDKSGHKSTPPGSRDTTDSSGSIDNGNSNPNFSTTTNDGSILSSSDLASAIKNEVHSIIRNTIGGITHKTPFLLPFH